jgi:hypothetical protein
MPSLKINEISATFYWLTLLIKGEPIPLALYLTFSKFEGDNGFNSP